MTYTLQAATVPTIVLSTTALSINALPGGTPPAAVNVTVSNGGAGQLSGLSVGAITDSGGLPVGWVTATLNRVFAPAKLTVTVAPPAGVAAGRYVVTIPVVSSVASNSPSTVQVAVIVPPPSIALSASLLTFAAGTGSGGGPAQLIDVIEPNGNVVGGLSAKIAYASGQPTGWLRATLSATTTPASIAVIATAGAGLAAGSYNATIQVNGAGTTGGAQSVDVAFTVTGTAPVIAISRSNVSFLLAPNGGLSPFETVDIANAVPGTIPGLAIKTTYATGQPTGWLRTTLSAKSTPASVTMSADAGALIEGQYDATVAVSGTGVSTQTIAVRLTIRRPIIAASATSALIPVQQGTTGVAVIAITNSGPGALTGLQAGPLSDYYNGSPAPWATASLNTTTAPATLTITASPGVAVAPGAYQLRFDLTSPVASNSPYTIYRINVTVIDQTVAPTGAIIVVNPTATGLTAAQGGSGTATLAVTNGVPGTTLGNLSVGTFSNYYNGAPAPWVTATLDQTTAPATITITAAPDATIPLGTQQLRFDISSPGSSNSPYTVFRVDVNVTASSTTRVAGNGVAIDITADVLVRAARELLGERLLTPNERNSLDAMGNHDGAFDLGDLVAALDRTEASIPQDLLQRVLSTKRPQASSTTLRKRNH